MTGATGLIGKALISRLLEQEAIRPHERLQITALVRNISKARSLLANEIELIADFENVDFNETDVVINLAGEPIADKRWSEAQKKEICNSRWQLTEQIAKAINQAKTPPKVFISGSAIGIYGRQSDAPINENFDDYHLEFTHKICQQWESLALGAKTELTRVCLLRTGIVLDANGGALKKMLPAFRFGLGGPLSTGNQIMSWIHISDMVRAIIYCIDNDKMSGAINMTAPKAESNEVFSKLLSKTLSRPCLFRVPALMLKVLLGEMSDLLLFGQNVIPEKLVENGFEFRHAELSEAFNDLLT